MTILRVIWDEEAGGNVEHIAEHGYSIEDVEHVLSDFHYEGVSKASGYPFVIGYLPDGRRVGVAFLRIDEVSILPVTAFDADNYKH
jgi:hypothetical protein